MVGKMPSGMPRSRYSGSHPSTQMTTVGRCGLRYRRPLSSITSDIGAPSLPGSQAYRGKFSRVTHYTGVSLPILRSAGSRKPGWHRSALARLVLRGRLGSAVLGAGRGPFLLPLQLFVLSGLLGAVALGTLIAI